MKLIKLKCENCGAILEVDSDRDFIYCEHCGAKNLIDDEATSVKRVENAKLKARKDSHEQEMKERQDKLEQAKKEKEFYENISPGEKFKKGKISKIVLVFAIISVISIFTVDGFLPKFLAVIQSCLLVSGWLIGMEYIKEPFKYAKVLCIVLGFILIVPIINTNGSQSHGVKPETIDWELLTLSENLPNPELKKGHIYYDDEEHLNLYFVKVSSEQYNTFLKKCKKVGYTIESSNSFQYRAFNKEGFKLELSYYESNEEMHIHLESPMKFEEIIWPQVGLSTLIPKTNSKLGIIKDDDYNSFTMYVSSTSLDEFNLYVNSCVEVGFKDHYSKSEKSFSAYNSDKVKLSVSYEGFNIMKIYLYKDEDNEDEPENFSLVEVIDFSDMTKDEIINWCDENSIKCKFTTENSNSIEQGKIISQNVKSGTEIKPNSTIKFVISEGKKASGEALIALAKAKTYSDTLHMSKQGIYNQLTSSFEGFSAEDAQYAVNHLNVDWNRNALLKAKDYRNTLSMSKSAIYTQLTSSVEGFTASEAQYAIDHLDD